MSLVKREITDLPPSLWAAFFSCVMRGWRTSVVTVRLHALTRPVPTLRRPKAKRIALSFEEDPDVHAPDPLCAAAFSLGQAPSLELSPSLPGNILRILRPSSPGVKGFRISDTS
jgi:hypothetical protein